MKRRHRNGSARRESAAAPPTRDPEVVGFIAAVLRQMDHAANLVVATGHAMMGVSLAPITGEIVGNLINGERTAIDISLMDPDRYA